MDVQAKPGIVPCLWYTEPCALTKPSTRSLRFISVYIGAWIVLDRATAGHVNILLTRTLDIPSIGLSSGHFHGGKIKRDSIYSIR
jgi:hypothetical protein